MGSLVTGRAHGMRCCHEDQLEGGVLVTGWQSERVVMAASSQLLPQGPGAAGQAGQHRAVSGLTVGARCRFTMSGAAHRAHCCSEPAICALEHES